MWRCSRRSCSRFDCQSRQEPLWEKPLWEQSLLAITVHLSINGWLTVRYREQALLPQGVLKMGVCQ
ncbi:hypothetical protein EMIT043CA1_150002 [Pseudomonas brassicacearum]